MGAGQSKGSEGANEGSKLQLHVALQLQEVNQLPGGLCPHVFGAHPLVGAWDATKAVPMEREGPGLWELAAILPANHALVEFRFLLKPRGVPHPCLPEEGPERCLEGGALLPQGGPLASFRMAGKGDGQAGALLEFPVLLQTSGVSPFALAASWKAHVEALALRVHSEERGRHDVSMDGNMPLTVGGLSLDLDQYEVPTPGSLAPPGYAADRTEEPRLRRLPANQMKPARPQLGMPHVVSIKDLVLMGQEGSSRPMSPRPEVDEESVRLETSPSMAEAAPLPMTSPLRSSSDASISPGEPCEPEQEGMPEAAGAVAAAAAAERMLGPKERRRLAIVMVGLPARGKTFTATKLTRYLRWLGHDTKHFNVGKYRRVKLGAIQTSDFFRADNAEGMDLRNEVARVAFQDMLDWLEQGGQVGIFDATNSTKERRDMLLKLAEGQCKVIFLESMCTDPAIIDQNAQEKIRASPDYANMQDPEEALEDFRQRLANYEKVYEPVSEGSYIKLIDMVSGGGQMQVNNISGYLPGRIVFFLVNSHITPRPILFTRHGESMDNVRARIGGDSVISATGEEYALKLADFVHKRLDLKQTASIWTSTLQRTILTARHIHGYPKVQWRALDEINAGVCDGMTYEEIKETMPEDYRARKMDKLRYRYPRGESYLDVIQRLEPVIIELERQRSPVVVVAHQAVLRALYAYFMDKPLREIPHIEMPLHTIIELTTGVGVAEKRYRLMDAVTH